MKNDIKNGLELVLTNAHEIAEKIYGPGGWFYIQSNKNGIEFSDILSNSTKLNPVNFRIPEFVISFNRTQDLDDVAAGDEIEALEEWLGLFTLEDIESRISYPGVN